MRFVPGQRIKKVRGAFAHGTEAIYVGPACDPNDDPAYDMIVSLLQATHAQTSLFGLPILCQAVAGETLLAISDNWEPAIPPGLKSIEEEGELWETKQGELSPC